MTKDNSKATYYWPIGDRGSKLQSERVFHIPSNEFGRRLCSVRCLVVRLNYWWPCTRSMHVSLLGLLGRYDREIEFIHGNTAAVSRPALLAVQLISIHLSQTHGGRGARNYGYGGPSRRAHWRDPPPPPAVRASVPRSRRPRLQAIMRGSNSMYNDISPNV